MQLGIRLHDIENGTLEHRLEVAHAQGFKCGHMALTKVISEYSVDDSALTPGFAMYLKKIFAQNDLDMLQYAGIGVAMGNAEECVKQIADYVTTSVDDDGVINALKNYGIL